MLARKGGGYTLMALGLVTGSFVRPHVALLAVGAFTVALLVGRRAHANPGVITPGSLGKVVGLVVLVALGAFLIGIRDGLRHGGSVTISGFGTFVVTRRASRRGRNPRTGKVITIPSARVPRFRPSRGLRAAVR